MGILKWFKRSGNSFGKSNTELVERIHQDFFTEVDKLLSEAKITHSLDTYMPTVNKYISLKTLGFTNAKEVIEGEASFKMFKKLKEEDEYNQLLTKIIEYFSTRYPQYKFITEDSVLKLCNKYGLVYGEVNKYTGSVPEKNLKQLEQFKIDENDECYSFIKEKWQFKPYEHDVITREKCYINFGGFDELRRFEETKYRDSTCNCVKLTKCPLEIVAPVSDFNMKGMNVENFKISKIKISDPIVLKPVVFAEKKYYLIVTAWG